MEPRLEKLINAFIDRGWAKIGPVDVSSDWWFVDIIQLVSTWSPAGTSIYLTLLTDPAISKEKIVWCIGISSTVPDSRNFMYLDQVTLNNIKKTDLSKLVDKVNKIVLK